MHVMYFFARPQLAVMGTRGVIRRMPWSTRRLSPVAAEQDRIAEAPISIKYVLPNLNPTAAHFISCILQELARDLFAFPIINSVKDTRQDPAKDHGFHFTLAQKSSERRYELSIKPDLRSILLSVCGQPPRLDAPSST
eukprot:scaffold365783_cov18-Prasinocladus_malaysianus.AAC.1